MPESKKQQELPDASDEEEQAAKEVAEPAASRSGGFKNDPDDPTNPNEVIERHRRKLRP
jgi:hypothetical protein